MENDETHLVWAVLDLPRVPEAVEVSKLIAEYAQVLESNVIYTCTHNHSGIYADNPVFERWYGEPFTTKVKTYRAFSRSIIPVAIQAAQDNLRSARMGGKAGQP